MKITDLVFVGFNSRVVALDQLTGEKFWTWESPKGRGYVTILLDGERLFVSVDGYTYCLDALTGAQRWFNGLEGLGTGVTMLASAAGHSDASLVAWAKQAAEAAATATTAGS